MDWINDIQNTGSESMHIRNSNVDSEGVSMCHWTLGLIKINTLNIMTPIFTVVCNKCTCIIKISFLNNCRNEWMEYLCSTREGFYWYESQNKSDIFFLSYCTYKYSFHHFLWEPFRASPMLFGVICFSGRRNSRCETTGLTWSNLELKSSIFVLW